MTAPTVGGAPAVLHRDEHLVAVAKPSGLVVHRGGWADDDVVVMTLVRDTIGQHVWPVHRLDRGASGVLLFALDADTARLLHEQLERGAVTKRYLALVRGAPPASGVIDHPIPRREDGPRVPALTEYRRVAIWEERAPAAPERRYALVEAVPRTGRLHQIRRHLKHISHPLIGDVNYGKGPHNRFFRERFGLHRLALHAAAVSLTHPVTHAHLRIHAPLPDDLADPFRALGFTTDVSALVAAD